MGNAWLRKIIDRSEYLNSPILCHVFHRSTMSQVVDAGPSRPKPLLSRDEVAERICQGSILFIYRSQVVNATAWAPYHPGGALALLHFVGRDATDEVEAYHSPTALARMKRLVVGRVEVDELGWRPLTPPIALGLVRHPDGQAGHWVKEGQVVLGTSILGELSQGQGVDVEKKDTKDMSVVELSPAQLEPPQTELDLKREQFRSKAYRELRGRVEEAGLFTPPGPLAGYGSDIVRYSLLGGTAFYLFFTCVIGLCLTKVRSLTTGRRDGSDRWLPLSFLVSSITS